MPELSERVLVDYILGPRMLRSKFSEAFCPEKLKAKCQQYQTSFKQHLFVLVIVL